MCLSTARILLRAQAPKCAIPTAHGCMSPKRMCAHGHTFVSKTSEHARVDTHLPLSQENVPKDIDVALKQENV